MGGKDTADNLIDICPTCHDALHAIAHKLMDKKTSRTQILDSIALIYPKNKKAQDTCLELALHVRNAMIDGKEKGLGPNHLVSISTVIRMYYKPLIMHRVRELDTTQEDYIRGLILSDLAKRFNLNLNLSEEKRIMSNIKEQKTKHLETRKDRAEDYAAKK
jgi:DNA-directed RNA polymerase subunit F